MGELSVGGLASGLDTNAIIEGLTNIERSRVVKVEAKQEAYNVQLSAFGRLESKLDEFVSAAEKLNDQEQFDLYNIVSSDDEIATFKGVGGGVPGSYQLSVFQLARAEKLSSDSFSSQTDTLENLIPGFTGGKFEVNKSLQAETPGTVEIEIQATDTLKSLRNKINAAEDIGISANIIQAGTNDFRLVFSSVDQGASGATYTDNDSVLQDLGILGAGGTKGITSQVMELSALLQKSDAQNVTSATVFNNIQTAPDSSLSANDTITISGKDHNGNAVTGTLIISDPDSATLDDLLNTIEDTYNGMVQASIVDGKITITDSSQGNSQLSVKLEVNSATSNLALGNLSIATGGKDSVLQTGSDSFFRIDGMNIRGSSNSVENVVEGMEIQLIKADLTATVEIDVDRDMDGIKKNINDFISKYNEIVTFIRDETKVKINESDNKDGKDEISKGDLANDSTVHRFANDLRTAFLDTFEGILTDTPYTSLSAMGIKSDIYTGNYSLDDEKFDSIIKTNYDDIKRLFVTKSTSTNNN
ncbi:MAG: flagellar filament capping protein FliD, partial [bacterium]